MTDPIIRFESATVEFRNFDAVGRSFKHRLAMLPLGGQLTLTKPELDKAVKDKSCQLFPENFAIALYYNFV